MTRTKHSHLRLAVLGRLPIRDQYALLEYSVSAQAHRPSFLLLGSSEYIADASGNRSFGYELSLP
jgi:hypothetical protein